MLMMMIVVVVVVDVVVVIIKCILMRTENYLSYLISIKERHYLNNAIHPAAFFFKYLVIKE
jgi:hypothetical protein